MSRVTPVDPRHAPSPTGCLAGFQRLMPSAPTTGTKVADRPPPKNVVQATTGPPPRTGPMAAMPDDYGTSSSAAKWLAPTPKATAQSRPAPMTERRRSSPVPRAATQSCPSLSAQSSPCFIDRPPFASVNDQTTIVLEELHYKIWDYGLELSGCCPWVEDQVDIGNQRFESRKEMRNAYNRLRPMSQILPGVVDVHM